MLLGWPALAGPHVCRFTARIGEEHLGMANSWGLLTLVGLACLVQSCNSDPLDTQGERTAPTGFRDDTKRIVAHDNPEGRSGSIDPVLVGYVFGGTILLWLCIGLWRRRARRSPATVSNREPAAQTHDESPAVDNGRSQADEPLRDRLQLWENACARADLVSCRQMLSTLPSGTDPMVIARLKDQLRQVTSAAQRSLRAQFARCVREQHFADALAIGERICEQLPGSLMAADFERLRPHLLSRLGAAGIGQIATTQPRGRLGSERL